MTTVCTSDWLPRVGSFVKYHKTKVPDTSYLANPGLHSYRFYLLWVRRPGFFIWICALLTSAISGFIFSIHSLLAPVPWLIYLFTYLFYFPFYCLNLPGVEISFYHSDYPDVVTLKNTVFCWLIHIVLSCQLLNSFQEYLLHAA